MKFRTRLTVEDGMTDTHIDLWACQATEQRCRDNIVTTDYQPGNGTRYPVMISTLSPGRCMMFGYDVNCSLVTIQRFHPNRFISKPFHTDGRPISTHEVAEAFEFTSTNDACCVTELLGHMLGCQTDAVEVAEQALARNLTD